MIPADHILIVALMQFGLGLIGLLTRRAGTIVLVSALLLLNGVLIGLCAALRHPGAAGIQSAGVVVLVVLASLALVGAVILFSFHRFRRAVVVDEQDRLRH